ncbi:MAG: hypothetical protein Q4C15_02585 [Eubacteriales bacterium]|nr:hypothetical protein [Eubacteriales bacterium]
MSKSKNKGNKPDQNNKQSSEETKVKVDKEVEEKVSEETAEESVEETAEEPADEVAGEVADEVKTEEPAEEDKGDKADEAGEPVKAEKAEVKEEKKAGSSKNKPMSKKAKEREANAKFRALPFSEKCKKDPVIPVCIALVFVAIIVAVIYFTVPNAITPSMGMTLDEFNTRFNDTEVVHSLLGSGLDFRYGNVPYVDPAVEPSILGDQATVTGNPSYVDFFSGPSKSTINSGIEGATRRNDGELAYVRLYVEYGEDFNPVWMLLSSTFQTLYPELNMTQAMDLALAKLGEYNGDTKFYVKGDYGFRIVPVKKGEVTYIVIDVVPKKILNDADIREYIADTSASATVATESVDTAATSVAST